MTRRPARPAARPRRAAALPGAGLPALVVPVAIVPVAIVTVASALALAACGAAGGDRGPGADAGGAAASSAAPTATPSTTPGSTAAAWAPPPAGARFDYQIGGPYPPAPGVEVVERDHREPPADGVYSICYVNAFQTQPEQADLWLGEHPDLLLRRDGVPVEDPDWPGELVLDVSTAQQRAGVAEVVGAWIDGCADAGYEAVELDNLDTAARFPDLLEEDDVVAVAGTLVDRAHARGLAVAQKNAPELAARGATEVGFDFVVAEECQVYAECDAYTADYGDRVIEIEYDDVTPDNPDPDATFAAACAARGDRVSVLYRDRDVVPSGATGYRSVHC
ncbi:endo alpha-1,4 polygalactosaminidase [Puerhibacterium puerhi]|uniref:endo alpha-1,4 polygalactosaminidase n=1 Tax=Puerhibacterium puerhi TaxID=2692623 RepID=UPI001915579F|nr:endo alpha-1,4 polygalactosaminidase [Puerhibacterium puerhi]